MGNWVVELFNTLIIAVVFAFLVAKLLAIVVSFKDDNVRDAQVRISLHAVGDDNSRPPRARIPTTDENLEGEQNPHENLEGKQIPSQSAPEEDNDGQLDAGKPRSSLENTQFWDPSEKEEESNSEKDRQIDGKKPRSSPENSQFWDLSEDGEKLHGSAENRHFCELSEKTEEKISEELPRMDAEKPHSSPGNCQLCDLSEDAEKLRRSPKNNPFCDLDEKHEEKFFEPVKIAGEAEGTLEKKAIEEDFSRENNDFCDLDERLDKNTKSFSELVKGEVKEEAKEEASRKGIEVNEEKGRGTERFGESLLSDEDEWEGIDSSELDEMFGAAAAYVASMTADLSRKIPDEAQMQLYGLYKVATEGPCNVSQPSPLKIGARAKWNTWQRLGNMTPEAAMEQYVGVLDEIFPSWNEGLLEKQKKEYDGSQQSASSGGMNSVFSSFVHQEESEDEVKMEIIHSYASEGDTTGLLQLLDQGVPIDSRDSQDRTALQWAVDRGHLEIVELLVSKGADVKATDMEGQTALHYAIVCEREVIAKYLISHGADPYSKDNDGVTPYSLRPTNWYWLS